MQLLQWAQALLQASIDLAIDIVAKATATAVAGSRGCGDILLIDTGTAALDVLPDRMRPLWIGQMVLNPVSPGDIGEVTVAEFTRSSQIAQPLINDCIGLGVDDMRIGIGYQWRSCCATRLDLADNDDVTAGSECRRRHDNGRQQAEKEQQIPQPYDTSCVHGFYSLMLLGVTAQNKAELMP